MFEMKIYPHEKEIAARIKELTHEIEKINAAKAPDEDIKRTMAIIRERRILTEALGSHIANKIEDIPFE